MVPRGWITLALVNLWFFYPVPPAGQCTVMLIIFSVKKALAYIYWASLVKKVSKAIGFVDPLTFSIAPWWDWLLIDYYLQSAPHLFTWSPSSYEQKHHQSSFTIMQLLTCKIPQTYWGERSDDTHLKEAYMKGFLPWRGRPWRWRGRCVWHWTGWDLLSRPACCEWSLEGDCVSANHFWGGAGQFLSGLCVCEMKFFFYPNLFPKPKPARFILWRIWRSEGQRG